MSEVIIHTDGGSLGNPGPSATGIVIEWEGKKKTYANDIGEGTNNEAEYKALVFALKKTKALLGGDSAKESHLKCYMDSQLVASQLNHKYQIKNKNIGFLFIEAWNLMMDFGKIEFIYVPREQNQEADGLVKSVFKKLNQASFF